MRRILNQQGKVGWILLWALGVPIPVLLILFLIQNTQNRDAEAMHIKLDELIRAVDTAQNALLNLEELEEKDLDRIRAEYLNLAEQSRNKLRAAGLNEAGPDTTTDSSRISRHRGVN